MYNTFMDDANMLDTNFLFQPRGAGTAWLFRMATPEALIGRTNPRTGKPYGREIREGLGGVRALAEARKLRDQRLGAVRVEEARAVAEANGNLESALDIAESLRAIENPHEREAIESALVDQAERLEQRVGEKKAVRWYKAATGQNTPFSTACEKYKADRGKSMSRSTLNNLDTAVREFEEFAGDDVCLEDVERRMVARFVTEFLPSKKGPKAPGGQGPATIRKKVSQLAQVWRWAQQRGILPYSKETPWDAQAPSKKDVNAAASKRRPFTPAESKKLLAEAPEGEALGDTMRVALLTGVRLEEVASLDASQVDPKARFYVIRQGKSENAARVVPLVGEAHKVIKRRLANVNSSGPLFPEVPLRKSTGRRGGAISQAFTRLRRKVLGEHTDGELAQHCFRHTWRTAARRAGVDLRTSHEMGGWSRGKDTDLTYDHGLEAEQYMRDQKKVARWLRGQGYIG